MVKTTKAQRAALKRVFDRQPIRNDGPEGGRRLLSYRAFRASIQPSFGSTAPSWFALPACGSASNATAIPTRKPRALD